MSEDRASKERPITSLTLNDGSIKQRLGPEVLDRPLQTREDLIPFFQVSNQVVLTPETPNRNNHHSYLDINHIPGYYGQDKHFDARLIDSFWLEKLFPNEEQRKSIYNKLLDELKRAGTIDHPKLENLPPTLKTLDEKVQLSLPGWYLGLVYEPDTMDNMFDTFGIRLIKEHSKNEYQHPSVTLDLDYPNYPTLKIIIPLKESFDVNSSECQKAIGVMSKWLNLPYSPELRYQFIGHESDVDNPSRVSESFPDYFYRVLNNWKFHPAPQTLRALIGKAKDGSPILLLEDPTLSVNIVDLDRFMTIGFSNVRSGLTVNGHADIYEAFKRGIENGVVNQNLASTLPDENFEDRKWLHMFIDRQENGETVLREDETSNVRKENLKSLIESVHKQYGINYGGTIDRKTAERLAKQPMLIPKINEETAVIKEKYGSHAAYKFRQAAISGLIEGMPQALEIYDAYQKLLK